jgi:hypothetical protein
MLKPSVRFGYSYDVMSDRIETTSHFAADPAETVFKTTGSEPARSVFNTGLGLSYMSTADWDLSTNYDYMYKSSYGAHNFVLRGTGYF